MFKKNFVRYAVFLQAFASVGLIVRVCLPEQLLVTSANMDFCEIMPIFKNIEEVITKASSYHCKQMSEDCQVFVIATTRKKDDLNPTLTTATRLGIEQEISIPNSIQRAKVNATLIFVCKLYMLRLRYHGFGARYHELPIGGNVELILLSVVARLCPGTE